MENKRRTIRKEILYVLWFLLGFTVCYFLFVSLPPIISQKGEISSTTEDSSSDSVDNFITLVEYADTGFQPSSVTIQKGNYIVVRNISSRSLMWLNSDSQLLTTTRGYAQSEQIRTVLNDVGSYSVTNTFNLSHKLSVIVR